MPKLILRLEPLPAADPPSANSVSSSSSSSPNRHVVDLGDNGRAPVASTPLGRWSASVAAAHDPAMVLDAEGQVLSISASAAELLGCSDAGVIGRRLLDVIQLVDFETGAPQPDYASRIAPIAVLTTGNGLTRSLVRVAHSDASRVTIDVSAAPLHDVRGQVIGSIAFLAAVRG